jgi:predicted phosphodiesterase
MRALIVSDIHANLEALEAVLSAAPAYDVVWNLGDLVGYGANPNEVIDASRHEGTVFVRGNHDRACCGLGGIDEFNPIAQRAARWTEYVLTTEHRDWLRGLAAGPIHPDGPQVSCVHGSPGDEDEYIVTVRDAWPTLHDPGTRLTFFGHTHIQCGFATNDEEWFRLVPEYRSHNEPESYDLRLRESSRYLINPGSVGQPRDGDWRAAFLVYDDAEKLVTWYRVPYNVRQAQERIVAAGLPDRLAWRLRDGR